MRCCWCLCYFLLLGQTARSQSIEQVINSHGGGYRSGYYELQWSVGEMSLVNQMQSSANNFILTNGFLQPYSLFPIANFPAAVFAPAEIKVFPNPARDFVEIDFFMKQQGRLGLRLLDAAGQVVYSNAVNYYGLDLVHKIQVKQFSSGTYFLHVTLQGFGPYLSTFRTVRKGVYRIVKIP